MNTTTTFAATLGLDWADQKHDLWIRPADGGKAQHVRLEQTPEALHEWVAKLRECFGNRPIAIGINTSRGLVISALMAYDFIVFFLVYPKAMKDYRAAFSVSGAKDNCTELRSGAITMQQSRQPPLNPAAGTPAATIGMRPATSLRTKTKLDKRLLRAVGRRG